MISKRLENLYLKYFSVNLKTDVFKNIAKYCWKIIAKYRQISSLLPSGNGTSAERYLTIFGNIFNDIWQGKYSHLKLEIVAQKYC